VDVSRSDKSPYSFITKARKPVKFVTFQYEITWQWKFTILNKKDIFKMISICSFSIVMSVFLGVKYYHHVLRTMTLRNEVLPRVPTGQEHTWETATWKRKRGLGGGFKYFHINPI